MRHAILMLPRELDAPTGGCRYDRQVVEGLRRLGWRCDVLVLDAGFPLPDAQALAAADAALSALSAGTIVIADALAFGAMPEVAERHARRLRWVALVHHPLALETGLEAALARQLLSAERRALAAARRVVVTSDATADELVRLRMTGRAGVPAVVIEPGCDVAPRKALRRPGSGSGVRILCVASVTPRKGHAVLIEALAGLSDRAWELHNVGSLTLDAAVARAVQAAAAAHGLRRRVFWQGAADAEALPVWYASADLFVLPSLYEGYGMVVAEALAHGLAIVATRTGAAARLLADGAGVLVPPGDAKALRAALAGLLDDADARAALGSRAAAAAPSRLPSWSASCARWQALLLAVAAEDG